ncbi:hypothetical protein B0I37DRAFT_194577 [Chaetomium sp. MPI-CAGE-AT-0009]|nr:hypothetical protein B0I37DRAFT_194577 [Chaetomium sp. MPI-CAGE-AT-0009]
MNRFNFFTRPTATGTTNATADTSDPYDDRAPLSPRGDPSQNNTTTPNINIIPTSDDLEANTATREMAERTRNTPSARFLHRFRPAIPSFFSTASSAHGLQAPPPAHHTGYGAGYGFRPTSSNYSGDGLRGAPDTVLDYNPHPRHQHHRGYDDDDDDDDDDVEEEEESPKSPEFRLGARDLNLPGTRLHLPELERTWTQGSNGPPTRPGTGTAGVAAPEPAVVHGRRHGSSRSSREEGRGGGGGGEEEGRHRERRRRKRRRHGDGSEGGSGSGRSRGRSRRHREREGESRSERRERRERRRGTEGSRSEGSSSSSSSSRSSRTRDRPPPKNFLFCFPWIKSRRVRSQILRCFVSGMFLALTLSIYLALSLTQNVNSNEFTILMIIILLFVTIFFCHSLIRLCMLVAKARKREQLVQRGQAAPEMVSPGGYAIPREPIPVVLARDEEVAGIQSEATKTGPPAYGVWRESVRADPNRLYWMRNQHPAVEEVSDLSSSNGSGITGSTGPTVSSLSSQSSGRTPAPRPPSYSSDDGVSYVVEARPRSMAPRGNAPPVPHPSERGMLGSWF